MKIEYCKRYSNALGRDMEYKIYGHAGKPIVMIPTQGCRFYEFEDRGMLDIYKPYIDEGKVQVFAVDAIDEQTMLSHADPAKRIALHEQWISYIVYEAVPVFRDINRQANGWEQRFAVVGASMGALHASTLFFRFPDIFDALLGLSGIYTNEDYFGDYHDENTYFNAPEQFLSNMPKDHPYIQKYNRSNIILCVGQGAWESRTLSSTRCISNILYEKGIRARVEEWGADVFHDWYWWMVQTARFLPDLLSFD